MDRLGNISRHIERNVVFQTFREVPADFLHRLFHVIGYFHSIGTRKHVDTQYGSITSIDTTFSRIG